MTELQEERNIRLNRILFQYDLFPYRRTMKNGLVKLETDTGNYALKMKKMTDQQIGHLAKAYRLARQLTIDAVCPLPSKYGDLVIRGERTCFYLMPWFEETISESDLDERYQRLFVQAGRLHRQTLQDGENDDKLRERIVGILSTRKYQWERFLNIAEHREYPSPFEQSVLMSAGTYLTDIQNALLFFSQNQSEDENQQAGGVRRALCHGRLSPLHLLIENEQCCLTNFEECREDFFIFETAALIEQACVMCRKPRIPWAEWLDAYISACPLHEVEMAFLFHLLLCPKAPIELITLYTSASDGHTGHSEQWFVKRWRHIDRGHRDLVNYFTDYLEMERKKKEGEQKKKEETS